MTPADWSPADWQYRKAAEWRATDHDWLDVDDKRAIYRESSGAWVPAWIFIPTDETLLTRCRRCHQLASSLNWAGLCYTCRTGAPE